MKKLILSKRFTIFAFFLVVSLSISAMAQITIKIPKIKKPKVTRPEVETPKTTPPEIAAENGSPAAAPAHLSGRQMVMDDAYTFFEAEPVEEYDPDLRLRKDTGWYLRSNLRLLGTVPVRSAFKVVVKKNGKELSTVRCEGNVYTKSGDASLSTEMTRRDKDLNFEDFMYTSRCYDDERAVKPVGQMDVEIYFIDGDTDAEKLIRTYKIDVHKATRVRGSAVKPQPDVSHYYIQRHPEAAVAFLHITGNHTPSDRNGRFSYYLNDPATAMTPGYGQLIAYMSYSPERSRKSVRSPFLRCTVDGQRIRLPRDSVTLSDAKVSEYAIYTDRIVPEYKRGSAYRDDVKFTLLRADLPLYTGEGQYSKPPMKIEEHPGKWECRIVSNGVTYRTLRWEVGTDGRIVPHPEQAGGNVNLFYNTFLTDLEIPEGGAPIDHRLMPMPNAGLFYGIPWTSPEGKEAAARVPKKGNPFHVPSNKANN